MTYEQAQKILDRVREGVNYPPGIVDFALCLTGDLDAHETHGGATSNGVSYEDHQNTAQKNGTARNF
jgi:hypothetical protein